MPTPPTDGLVIVDKPAGLTSHDVVARMRRIAKTRKVGHAGTLDPMATGVLVLGVGRATRLLTHLVLADKAYTATIRLGQATVTDDAEGEVTSSASAAAVTEADVRAAMAPLHGRDQQVPSAVSAIKIDGERSYKRVREGASRAVARAAGHGDPVRGDGAAPQPPTCSTSTSRSSAPRAPTSAHWPATSVPRSASAGT